jgi:hypothetical protein
MLAFSYCQQVAVVSAPPESFADWVPVWSTVKVWQPVSPTWMPVEVAVIT